MKTYFKILLVTAIFASSCSPSYMGTAVYEDDLYYNPNEAPLLVQKVEAKSPAVKKSNALAPANATPSSTKTNPNIGTEALEDRNFDALQQKYTDILNNESIDSVDTLIYEGDSGYYLGGFSGSERDQEEAQRLREMYPQGFGYYDNSGYNTAMWLAGDSDWNVYMDGNNVWWTPTWTNYRFYNGYNYSSMRYGNTFAYNYPYGSYGHNSYWGFNMGFGDSWYWDLNFGFGFSNYYYGSYYPYHGHHRHHGHHGYYGHHGSGYYNNQNYIKTTDRYGERRAATYKPVDPNNPTSVSGSNRRSSTRSSKQTGLHNTTRRTTSSTANDIRRSNAATRYSSGNGNTYGTRRTVLNSTSGRRSTYGTNTTRRTGTGTRSNYSNGNTNQSNRSSYSTNTRRSSSPSYNKQKTNTRPSYNRASTTRNSNYSKSATRSSYSKVKNSSSKPVYRSGSSRSKSSYSNSGARRSSGSSVRSTRSSSRSSGSSTRSSSGSTRSSSGSSKSSNSGSTRRR